MGYSLQRPLTLWSGDDRRRIDGQFQWATHSNAHSHDVARLTRNSTASVSIGYSLQRPLTPPKPFPYKPVVHGNVSMGYSLQRPLTRLPNCHIRVWTSKV